MLEFVVGDVEDGEFVELLNVFYFGDLVLLHVEFFESVFEGD